jgi:hypothetical protein
MGYDVHITRADDGVDGGQHPITLEEWLSYVEHSPEFRHDGYAEATTTQGETIRTENQGLSVWMLYSGHGVGGNMAWFDYWRGCVVVKNPDEEILIKMYQVAQAFQAKVQGDEGEIYDQYGQSNWKEVHAPRPVDKKPWWKFW